MVILDMYYTGIYNININYYTLFIEQSNRTTYFSEMYQITTWWQMDYIVHVCTEHSCLLLIKVFHS